MTANPGQAVVSIRPVDTWMFRDGRPFNQDDPGAAQAVGVFPPFPPTIVGMVRAQLAVKLGWNGSPGTWPAGDLGDGVNWQSSQTSLHPLRFSRVGVYGPFSPRGGAQSLLFPVPRALLASKKALAGLHSAWRKKDQAAAAQIALKPVRLAPQANSNLRSDLPADARFPVAQAGEQGIDVLNGWWITAAGLQQFLAGACPDKEQLAPESAVLEREPRVGIAIDGAEQSQLDKRRVIDGALYMAGHIRLRSGVALQVTVRGLPDMPRGLLGIGPAGGESRTAEFTLSHCPEHGQQAWPAAPVLHADRHGRLRYVVYHASPCLIGKLPGPGDRLDGLPGRVVSACLDRAMRIGGWDSQQRRPIAMAPAIPAGSVWFMETDAGECPAEALASHHEKHIGHAPEWGFGQILIGAWPEDVTGAEK